MFYLDAPSLVPSDKLHNCCDVCKSLCGCQDCNLKVHTQTADVADAAMSEATVFNEDASLKLVEKLQNYFTSLKKVKTNMSNKDQAGSALPNTLWKILCLKERKFLLCLT